MSLGIQGRYLQLVHRLNLVALWHRLNFSNRIDPFHDEILPVINQKPCCLIDELFNTREGPCGNGIEAALRLKGFYARLYHIYIRQP